MKKNSHQQMLDECLQGEVFTLLYINNRENTVLPRDISEEMNISTARVATILNSLENKGFVERQIDREDRRRILVTLTQKGKVEAKEHKEEVINQIAKMLELLGEEDAKDFIRITGRIVDLASKSTEN